MSWKWMMREAERAVRDSAKHQQAVDREGSKRQADLERNTVKAKSAIEKALDNIARDPIKAFTLAYSRKLGLTSRELRIVSQGYETGLKTSLREVDTQFNPRSLETSGVRVSPLKIFADATCTLIAVEVNSPDSVMKIAPGLVNRSNPQSSKAVLVRSNTSDYLYPLSTDLSGEILRGHPRAGLVAFPSVRRLTGDWEFHILRLASAERNPEALTFRFSMDHDSSTGLEDSTDGVEVLRRILMDDLEAERSRIAGLIDERIAEAKGCAIAGLLLLGTSLRL